MRRILRSDGNTFTDVSPLEKGQDPSVEGPIERGLEKTSESALDPPGFAEPGRVWDITEYLREHPKKLLGQIIAILDMVVQKRNRLIDYNLEAYLDRSAIARCLWARIEGEVRSTFGEDPAKGVLKELSEIWLWRVHPYARRGHTGLEADPSDDVNGRFLRNNVTGIERTELRGRWHEALFVGSAQGGCNAEATADRIWHHLTTKAIKIYPKARVDKHPKSQIEKRGVSISTSVRDPRTKRKDDHYRNDTYTDKIADMYFAKDLAASIFSAVRTRAQTGNAPVYASDLGKMIFDHFGSLKPLTKSYSKDEKRKLWALQNRIRKFYATLVRSTRFQTALQLHRDSYKHACAVAAKPEKERPEQKKIDKLFAAAEAELTKIIPQTRVELLNKIGGREKGSDYGELIRLGKLVVHASDLPKDMTEGIDDRFRARLDALANSDGQAEIKRNEAFARIWRNAVGMSQRSLRIWAETDPSLRIEGIENGKPNTDLATHPVSGAAVQKHFKNDHFSQHAKVLFGSKPTVQGTSRAGIIVSDDPVENKEMLWTMLRLAGEVRNRANHFCTMRRIVDLLMRGLVEADDSLKPGKDLMSRNSFPVLPKTLERLENLLSFDKSLQRQVFLDDVNRIGFADYVPTEHRDATQKEICAEVFTDALPQPRFMSILRRAAKLAESDVATESRRKAALATLDLTPDALTKPGVNKFRVELLRMCYAAGFRGWLVDQCADKAKDVAEIVDAAIDEKMTRAQIASSERWIHHHTEHLLDKIGIERKADLVTMLQSLTAAETAEERLNQTYRADPKKQQAISNRIELFRQEIFLGLFERYISDVELDWIWKVGELDDPTILTALGDPGILPVADWKSETWHSQFYAWLYLVPVDEIAMLRHQFLKTRALDRKAAEESDATLVSVLNDLDRLMALYGKVNTAGFDGTEHEDRLTPALLYQDDIEDVEVDPGHADDHEMSLPGTRRGLRQILRFGHMDILKRILEKHQVTSAEVEHFASMSSDKDRADPLRVRIDIRKEIVNECKSLKEIEASERDTGPLDQLCASYETAACEFAWQNFTTNAVRLTEFARFHHVLMRIIGRLTDYTLMWERDMQYLYLGLLYRQTDGALKLERVAEETPGRKQGNRLCLTWSDRRLDLWDDHRGYCQIMFNAATEYLGEDSRSVFNRVYAGTGEANEKDVASNTGKPKKRPLHFHAHGHQQIRNDFAHYNVLTKTNSVRGEDKKPKLNLNYLVGAVRSMFGHDRKLKNAVTQSVIRILREEGITLSWTMREDRPTNARVGPVFETHLTMVPQWLKNDAQILIPRASPRFTSMVKAMFEFGSSGYWRYDDNESVGELRYPNHVLSPGARGSFEPGSLPRNARLPGAFQRSQVVFNLRNRANN